MSSSSTSAITSEINAFSSRPVADISTGLSAIIYANGGPFIAWKILNLTRIRDYETSIADVFKIVVRIGLGDYVYRVFPSKINTHIVLRKADPIKAGAINSHDFIAFINMETAPVVTSASNSGASADTLNLSNLVDVEFDLVPSAIIKAKNLRLRGTYRDMSAKTLMQTIFDKDIKPLGIEFLHMYKPDNETVRKNMVLSDGVHALSLPTYMQHSLGGLYNEGIGTYVQSNSNVTSMYIYPLYNLQMFSSAKKRLVVVLAQQSTYAETERSYYVDGDTAHVLITGDRKLIASADSQFENDGVGFRRVAAGAMMTKPVGIAKGAVKSYSADLLKQEVIGDVSGRVTNRPNASRAISDNPHLDRSKLSYRKCSTMMLTWENSNDELLYPGMACRVITTIDNKVVMMDGSLVYSETVVSLQGVIAASSSYSSTTLLKVMVGDDRSISSDRAAMSGAVEPTKIR
jgi:hypothetical protein